MPRTDVFVAREDIAVAIDEGDVDGIGHKTRMDRRAAWKRHDERQAVGGNRTPSQHAAQAHDKRLRYHKLGRRPTQPIECPRVGDVGRDRGHMTTPGATDRPSPRARATTLSAPPAERQRC